MTICLLDHDLRKLEDNGTRHSLTVAEAFLQFGGAVEVWPHTSCDINDARVKPLFRLSQSRLHALVRTRFASKYWRWIVFAGVFIWGNLRYLGDLLSRPPEPGRVLFVVNCVPFNTLALHLYAALRRRERLALYFFYPPSRLANGLLGDLRRLLRLENIGYATEVPSLAEDWATALKGSCSVVPFPLPVRTSKPPVAASTPRPLRGVFAGQPRAEKGFDILCLAIRQLEDDLIEGRLALDIQISDLAASEKALHEHIRYLQELALRTENLVLRVGPLSETEYAEQFEIAHFVMLPYRNYAYAKRGSGIVVETLVAGKPIIMTSGLSFGKDPLAEESSLRFADGDSAGLARAIREMQFRFASLQEKACEVSQQATERHSIGNVVKKILEIPTA
jgi:glycosyltransferase involved in cell wall biosynthesis